MNEAKKIWKLFNSEIQSKISTVGYDMWFSNLEPLTISGDKLVVVTPFKNAKVKIPQSYKTEIKESIEAINSYITDIIFITPDEKKIYTDNSVAEKSEPVAVNNKSSVLNQFYTFDSFVVGPSNQLVYSAAKAVAENPGANINPLFIYGGVGLGKTHIMHSIGNYILAKNPSARVLYSTTEQFVNDFIDSFSNSSNNEKNRLFREKYRNVDVLMLDDIQFLQNKTSCQEALFHTFNDLYQSSKQIVLSSDRHPRELTFLSERLQSRFQSGMSIDIAQPDLETRIAILQKKAFEKKVVVTQPVIYYIAENITSNIRELEGALTKFIYSCTLLNIEPNNIDVAKEVLKDDIDVTTHVLSADTIVEATCAYFNISKADVLSKKKTKTIAMCRQICIYLIYDILGQPLATIGNYFGGKDHTTIMYAKNKISSELESNNNLLKMQINDIKNIIQKR
ncbi:MAG: chromosomal replication initiator protein DnaA [Christensenellales bacterium]